METNSFFNYAPAFNTKSVRKAFTEKVFTLCASQLLMTTLIVCAILSNSFLLQIASVLNIPCALGGIVLIIALGCSKNLARQVPTNYVLLGLFTLFESITLGYYLSFFDIAIVGQASVVTACIVFATFLAAKSSKFDMTNTKFFGYMALFHLVLLVLSLFFFRLNHIFFAYLGAIMYTAYLILDIQLIMGNKDKMTSTIEV